MLVKGIRDEDFVNYKVPSMFISTAICDFKCNRACGRPVCQNSDLGSVPDIFINEEVLAERYVHNPITRAVVFGGLEPMDQLDDLEAFLTALRKHPDLARDDDVVIYSGYTKEELEEMGHLQKLRKFGNIIVKFGRFIPDQAPHFDHVLGVYLASNNQRAERL